MNFNKNQELLEMAIKGDEKATEELMTLNLGLVRSIALKFRDRGVEYEDLVQIGSIGMLKAIRSFDLEKGTVFSTYAVPKITGEIRRYMRDDGAIKVSRNVKEKANAIKSFRNKFMLQEGTEPSVLQIANATGYSPEEIAVAESMRFV